MGYILIGIKMILLFLSNLGYWKMIKEKTEVNKYYLPVITIAWQILILFFAGLLNILPEITFLIFGGGIYLFLYGIKKEKSEFISEFISVGYIYIAICLFISALVLKGCIFTHYDNFSHWAIVIKEMFRTNGYPTFKNPVILFQGYPLGSATYIYYFSKIVSQAESIQMLAQVYMMLACLLPIFSFCEKIFNKILLFIVMIFFTNYIFVYNIAINNLLVDTLLPLFGVATMLYAYYECYKKYEVDNEKYRNRVLCLMPLMVSVGFIKNSGIYFIVFTLIIMGKILKTHKKISKSLVLSAVSPFLISFLWKRHCEYVYYGAATAKHSMSLANYKSQLLNKDTGDIIRITKAMIEYSVTGKTLYFIMGTAVLLGIVTYFVQRDFLKIYFKVMIVSIAIYTLYMIGMLGMYIFSMPIGEALELASVGRYRRTIFTVIMYLYMIYSVKLASSITDRKRIFITYIMALFVIGAQWKYITDFSTILNTKDGRERREWMETQIVEYNVPLGDIYGICIPEYDAGYMHFMGRYLFNTTNINSFIVEDETYFDKLNNQKYIFNLDPENEFIKKWIKENYPEQIGNEVIITEGDKLNEQ